MVWAGVALSLLPDVDAVVGLLLGDMGRYHNQMMCTPLFALIFSIVTGLAGWHWRGAFRPWFILAFSCYLLHITLDFFTHGRGIMLLWPLSEERFRPPFTIFYGVHWSDGLFSSRHIWTALTEIATFAAVWLLLALYVYLRERRTSTRQRAAADITSRHP